MDQRTIDLGRLGLDPEATAPQIAATFRTLAFSAHPDRGGDEATMIQLTAARDRLLSEAVPVSSEASAHRVSFTAEGDVDQVRAHFYLVPMVLMPALVLLLLVVIAGAM